MRLRFEAGTRVVREGGRQVERGSSQDKRDRAFPGCRTSRTGRSQAAEQAGQGIPRLQNKQGFRRVCRALQAPPEAQTGVRPTNHLLASSDVSRELE